MKKHRGLPAGRRGFTLIEMLVVMFVITTISTIMVVNWRNNEKRYLLGRAAQEIVQNIRKTQTMALEGQKYNGDVPTDDYGLNFKLSQPNSYFIYADWNGNNKYQPADGDIVIETIPVADNVEIYSLSSTPQDMDITFSVPDGFIVLNPHDASAIIGIRRTGLSCPGNCKNIIINKSGQVTIE